MAENTIVLAKSFTPLLDEVYKKESVTSDLTGDANMARAGANAKEIVYPQIAVTGLGDYDRNSGYTQGTVDFNGYQQNTTTTEVPSCLLM